MNRKAFAALFILLTLPAAFFAAAQGWRTDNLSILDKAGKIIFSAPVPFGFRFTTSYIHSVERTPVEDEYALCGGRLWVWQERVKSSNAGMPCLKPEHGLYISTPEWMIFQGGRESWERFFLRVGNVEFGRNKLRMPPFGETELFKRLPEERLTIAASADAIANSRTTGIKALFGKKPSEN